MKEVHPMRTKLALVSAVVVLLLTAVAAPLPAHHAFAAEFDANKPVKFEGTVTRMQWTNPHVWLYVDVKKPDGKVENWAFEAGTRTFCFDAALKRMLCCPELRSSWTDTSPRTGHTGQTAGISLSATDASCFSAQRARALHTSYRHRSKIKLKLRCSFQSLEQSKEPV